MNYQRTGRTLKFCGQNAVSPSGGLTLEGRCGIQNVRMRNRGEQGGGREIAEYPTGTGGTALRG